jgi:hypothetical protein
MLLSFKNEVDNSISTSLICFDNCISPDLIISARSAYVQCFKAILKPQRKKINRYTFA